MAKKTVQKIKESTNEPLQTESLYLSTGSTLINLCCTEAADKGFSTGHYYLLVGESGAGKTWMALTCLAEAALDPKFKDYRLVFNCPEDGALMDLREYFGPLERRIETIVSPDLEGFYFDLDDRLKEGKPLIYVLDSMDALQPQEDMEYFEKAKKAYKTGEEGPGSYKTAKARSNSDNLRKVISNLKKTGSILIVIAQAKDKIQSFGFDKTTRSGGRALKFYATCELWFSITESITKTVKYKNEKIGEWLKIQVKKNRQTGVATSVDIPFLVGYGTDDTGACVEFLCERHHWKSKETTVTAPEFDFDGKKEHLIQKIEEEGRTKELHSITESVWKDIRRACEPQRRNKYANFDNHKEKHTRSSQREEIPLPVEDSE